jgi:endonuclease/exonuclease/phosphatase family metal-dependent hydrolase
MARVRCSILTLNIFHDLPTYRHLDRRLNLIAEEIAARRPAVAAIQELLRAGGCGDLGARLRDAVNRICGAGLYRLDYAVADGAGEGEFSFDEGIGLLSRIDPDGPAESLKYQAQVGLEIEIGGLHYRLPDHRVALRRRFRLSNGAKLEVYVTHLTDRPELVDGIPARTAQARELVHWASSDSERRTTVIVAGDLNDLPDSETVASFTRAGFVDLYGAYGAGPGYTNDRNDIDLCSEAATHNQRIDYLLMRAERSSQSEAATVALCADRPRCSGDGAWLWPSDHVGVMATLNL